MIFLLPYSKIKPYLHNFTPFCIRLRIVTKFDGLKLERPHICCWTLSGSTCGRAFTRSDLLNRHIKSLHTRKKELNCKVEGCDYLCGRSDHLKSHVRNRHKEVYSHFYPADGAGGGSDEAPKKVVKRGQDASQDLGYLGEIQRIKGGWVKSRLSKINFDR